MCTRAKGGSGPWALFRGRAHASSCRLGRGAVAHLTLGEAARLTGNGVAAVAAPSLPPFFQQQHHFLLYDFF